VSTRPRSLNAGATEGHDVRPLFTPLVVIGAPSPKEVVMNSNKRIKMPRAVVTAGLLAALAVPTAASAMQPR
jgi:hypothetical protein